MRATWKEFQSARLLLAARRPGSNPNSAEAMSEGLQCVRPGGQALFFTPAKPGEKLTIDPNYLYFNDINISTS